MIGSGGHHIGAGNQDLPNRLNQQQPALKASTKVELLSILASTLLPRVKLQTLGGNWKMLTDFPFQLVVESYRGD